MSDQEQPNGAGDPMRDWWAEQETAWPTRFPRQQRPDQQGYRQQEGIEAESATASARSANRSQPSASPQVPSTRGPGPAFPSSLDPIENWSGMLPANGGANWVPDPLHWEPLGLEPGHGGPLQDQIIGTENPYFMSIQGSTPFGPAAGLSGTVDSGVPTMPADDLQRGPRCLDAPRGNLNAASLLPAGNDFTTTGTSPGNFLDMNNVPPVALPQSINNPGSNQWTPAQEYMGNYSQTVLSANSYGQGSPGDRHHAGARPRNLSTSNIGYERRPFDPSANETDRVRTTSNATPKSVRWDSNEDKRLVELRKTGASFADISLVSS